MWGVAMGRLADWLNEDVSFGRKSDDRQAELKTEVFESTQPSGGSPRIVGLSHVTEQLECEIVVPAGTLELGRQ